MSRVLARLIVRASAWIAPSALRARWREEWLAEIDREAPAGAPSPLVRALGAPIDALRAPRHYSLPGWLDLRLAVRTSLANPVVSVTSVLALGVGIALATAAFTVVHSVLHGKLEASGGDQVLALKEYDRLGGWRLPITPEEHERRRHVLTSYVDIAAYHLRTDDVTFEGGHEIRRITVASPNLFNVLGVSPMAGRLFETADAEPGAARVVLLGERVARAYGLAPVDAVGRRIDVSGKRYDVVGVIPDSCRFPFNSEIWVPLPRGQGDDYGEVLVVARARAGLDLRAAAAELRVVAAQVPHDPREQRDQRVVPFATAVDDAQGAAVGWAIVGALVLLLLVAAANVANLLLARSAARQRDLAIRTALGASRGRIVGAIAIEAALLAAVAAALGLAGARVALTIFRSVADDLPYWMRLDLDFRVFAFAVGVAALATLVAGVAPALKVTRGSIVDPLRTGHATLRFGRLSAAITVVEAALAVGLLTGAASFAQALVGFGFQSYQLPEDRVAIAQIFFPAPAEVSRSSDSPDQREAKEQAFLSRVQQDQRDLAARIAAMPGVRRVAYGWHFPGTERRNRAFEIQGAPEASGTQTRFAQVGAGFFAVLGAPMSAGRDFTQEDVDLRHPVAIVNEPFAKKYFGGATPIGRRLRLPTADKDGIWRDIVGVVPDLGLNPGDATRADGVYIPLEPSSAPRVAWLTDGNPLSLAAAVHEAVRQLPTEARVLWSRTLASNLEQSASLFRGLGYGLLAIGGVALILTCTAIHAIVAFSLAQRRRELAVRLALGAGARGVVRALIGRTARQLAAGAILGALLAVAISQMMGVLPMDVPRGGLWRPLAMMALIVVAGLSACAGPLRRALALKPLDWLRE